MISLSIPFFRNFEDSGWLEDALFNWSFWIPESGYVTEVQENMKQQIDCSSCNQKVKRPFYLFREDFLPCLWH